MTITVFNKRSFPSELMWRYGRSLKLTRCQALSRCYFTQKLNSAAPSFDQLKSWDLCEKGLLLSELNHVSGHWHKSNVYRVYLLQLECLLLCCIHDIYTSKMMPILITAWNRSVHELRSICLHVRMEMCSDKHLWAFFCWAAVSIKLLFFSIILILSF